MSAEVNRTAMFGIEFEILNGVSAEPRVRDLDAAARLLRPVVPAEGDETRLTLDLDFGGDGRHYYCRIDQRNPIAEHWTGVICHDHFGGALNVLTEMVCTESPEDDIRIDTGYCV